MISPDELRRQLADLADSVPSATRDAGQAVRRRYRKRRLGQTAAAVVVSALVAGVVVVAVSGGKAAPVHVSTGPVNRGADQTCAIPTLPAAISQMDPLVGQPLTGPAPRDLRGGPASAPFTLDNGALEVSTPLHGDKPKISAVQAECAALASLTPDGTALVNLASGSGVAVGYGRVTISPQLVSSATADGPFGTGYQAPSPAQLPAASPYDNRLAWIVVVGQATPVSHGPPTVSSSPSTTVPAAMSGNYHYEVFVIDATTGSAALLYNQAQALPTGSDVTSEPTVVIPVEQFSVPWTLTSRSPGGYSATVNAIIQGCDGYPSGVNVDSDDQSAAVVVYGPVGPPCGGSRQVAVALDAPTVMSDLPANIAHDPVGPYIAPIFPQPRAPTPGRTFKLVGPQDSGSTIHLSIGSVVSVGGLMANRLAVSSNTSVLGPLVGMGADQGFGGVFRAWTSGQADLTVPESACDSPDKTDPPCSRPWILHVDIP